MVDNGSVKRWVIVNLCPPILLVLVFLSVVICAMSGVWVVASACVFVNCIFVGEYFGAVAMLIVSFCSFSMARSTFLWLKDRNYNGGGNLHSFSRCEYFLFGIAVVCMILEGKI